MSAAVFVADTMRALSLGLGSPDDRLLRAEALRTLGGRPSQINLKLDHLGPNERIRVLSDTLIDSLAAADDHLQRPHEFDSRLRSIAEEHAYSISSIRRAGIAIRASQLTCIVGEHIPSALRLAMALAGRVYGYHARVCPGPDATGLLHPPSMGTDEAQGSPGGFFYRTVASNWRRDELDVFQPEQEPPQSRMPLLARYCDGWRVYQGGWLVVPYAGRVDEVTLLAIEQALDQGVLESYTADGRISRLAIPRDFRVILISQWQPSGIGGSTPVIHLQSHSIAEDAIGRWVAVAENRVGPSPDDAAAGGRRHAAQALYSLTYWLGLAVPCDHAFVETALCTAIIQGGDPERSARDAAMDLLYARFDQYSSATRNFIRRMMTDDDPIQKRAALLTLIRDGGLLDQERYYEIFGSHGASIDDDNGRRGDVVSQAPVELFSMEAIHTT
tara:strand:- start:1279 stop:2610 length:1332 start_codon:yes stop_codon:yes gene_type:complete